MSCRKARPVEGERRGKSRCRGRAREAGAWRPPAPQPRGGGGGKAAPRWSGRPPSEPVGVGPQADGRAAARGGAGGQSGRRARARQPARCGGRLPHARGGGPRPRPPPVSSPAQRHARGADPPCLPRAPLQRLCQGPPPRGWLWEAGDGCVGVGEAGGLVFQICGISTCGEEQTSGPQGLDSDILTVKSVSERMY